MRLCAARERSFVQRSILDDARMMSRTLSRWPYWRESLALLARRCSAHALDVPDPALQRLPRTPHGTTARFDLVEELPTGVQLVGRRFREDVILDAMAAIEQRAGRLVDRLWQRV